MTAAIDFAGDAFLIPLDRPMGRNFAGHGFLSALARHSTAKEITGLVRSPAAAETFTAVMKGLRPDRPSRYIKIGSAEALQEVGCLYTSGILTPALLWQREMHGPRSWSLCGVNHTLSSARAMDGVAQLLTAPVQPWDALICTSTASRDVIRQLLDKQAEYLARRLGASRFVVPQLPIIPLGVDCDAQQREAGLRGPARAALEIGPDDVVVLFLGRISFHAKASPIPMYLALERIAQEGRARRRIVLLECGWFANDGIAQAFHEARTLLCPSVRSIVLDGREPLSRSRAWAAADVFCSLSDNIQGSFGLTPIEAMAAGLPVVVTDWNGYRDTVRNGIDGFAIPTLFAPAGTGTGIAARHAMEVDTYDRYIGHVAASTVVDVDATADAFRRLVTDPELRRRMGASAAERARAIFDWTVVIGAYEDLWAKLGELRRSAPGGQPGPRAPRGWPTRPDPFALFAGFPSAVLTDRHRVTKPEGIDEEAASTLLDLKVSMLSGLPGLSPASVLGLWRRLGPEEASVDSILALDRTLPRAIAVRTLLALAKIGLVRIAEP